jgi:excisionase family DNA binding protein
VEKLITPQELSGLLHIKLSTVYKWVHYGYVPFVKLGTCVRFREIKIQEWVKRKERVGRLKYRRQDIDIA